MAFDEPAEELVPHAEGLPGEPSGLPEADDCRRRGELLGKFVERGVGQRAEAGLLWIGRSDG
ncbi:hypothetical protein [Kitasatospora aureofaciens]|uniref:hypothetical protein n=1 Tax=Kitasatospora aureofaciens TaxID=1894 RepID=UPI003827C0CF